MPNEPESPYIVDGTSYCLIAIPSQQCLLLPKVEIAPNHTPSTLPFVVEELVPIDAERLSLAYCGDSILAIDGAELGEWFGSHNENTAPCIAAIPKVLLIQQGHGILRSADEPVAYLISDDQVPDATAIDFLVLSNRSITAWQWLRNDIDPVMNFVVAFFGEHSQIRSLICLGTGSHKLAASFSEDLKRLVVVDRADTADLAAQGAKAILTGREQPLTSFLGDPTSRFLQPNAPTSRLRQLLAVCVLLTALSICLGLNLRAHYYFSEANKAILNQEQTYQELFPKQSVPVGVRSRLESELRRLSGKKGTGTNVPELHSVLPTMQKFWHGIPVSTSFSIESLHFAPLQLKSCEGVAKTYDELEAFRQGLKNVGFNVPVVSATQNSRGVSLRLLSVPLSERESMQAGPKEKKP